MTWKWKLGKQAGRSVDRSTTDLVSIIYASRVVLDDDACIYVLPAYFMVP